MRNDKERKIGAAGLHLRVLDSWDGVFHLLQCGWDSDNLLDSFAKTVHVMSLSTSLIKEVL